MNKIVLRAFPVKQGDTTFYMTTIKAGNLVDEDYYRVDRWNPANQEGYQREINQTHAHRLGRYLGRGFATDQELHERGSHEKLPVANNNNMLPSAVVINFRHPLEMSTNDKGNLEITLDRWPGYIIDGQHRIEAARELIESGDEGMIDYEFPVTLTNLPLEDEMTQFRNLNSTANRPPRGLNQAIAFTLQNQYGRVPMSWGETATNNVTGITMRIASDSNSPWYGRIALGGIRKRAMHSTVQSQFSDSISTLFTRGRFSDPKQDMDKAYEMIREYWEAVVEVWPGAANNETSLLFVPRGFFPLNRVLDRVFNNITLTPTKEDFVEVLETIRDRTQVDDAAWERNGKVESLGYGFSNSKGLTVIADFLWSGLDEGTKTRIRTKLPVK